MRASRFLPTMNALNGKLKGSLSHDEYLALTAESARKIAAIQVEPGTEFANDIAAFQSEIAALEPSPDGAVFDPGSNELSIAERPFAQQCTDAAHEIVLYGDGG